MKKVMITAALALMTMGAMAQTLDNDTTCYEPEHLFKVGVVPKFKSGKWAFIQYLYNNLRYPKEAEKEMVEAKVLTTFIVEKDGSLSNITPVKTTLQFFDAKKKAQKLGMTEDRAELPSEVIDGTKTKKRGNLSIPSFSVGITGLEPATSRPPDVCATNCAKSRSNSTSILTVVFECGCKGTQNF